VSRLAVLAALAGTGLMAAGCSHHSTPSGSSTSTTQVTSSTTSRSSTPSSTSPSSTTTSAGTAVCHDVTAASTGSQGAAGTIVGTISLTNDEASTCTMMGYPTMALFGAGGTTITVTMEDGLTVDVSGPATQAPALVTLAPAAQAEFTYQYSDVPSGTETSCASSTMVGAVPPGATSGSSPQIALSLDPCDNGTIHVSPVYAAG